jgi:hypothetical protein
MSHPHCARARSVSGFLRSLPILLSLFALSALTPQPARAGDAETADLAVDLFIKAGSKAGLPITEREGHLVKEIVKCGIAGTPVEACVRNTAVAVALREAGASKEMTDAAQCLVGGKPATTCMGDALVKKLPVETQPLVSCMLSGKGDIAGCTKKFAEGLIISKVPQQFQPAATCIVETGDPKKCATELIKSEVTKHLPASIRAQASTIVTCLGSTAAAASCATTAAVPDQLKPLVACATAPGANVGQCAANFAAQHLPAGTPQVAKDMAACIGASDFAKCAQEKGIANAKDFAASQLSPSAKAAIDEAMKTIDKLRPDAPITMEAGIRENYATLKNIMMVAQGIKDGDWGKVLVGAGPELAIVASNVILSIFISPPLAAALSPAVAAMIHHHVDGAKALLQAAGNGDGVGMAVVVFDWYAKSFINQPCALTPDGKVKEAICGGLSDAIKFVSEQGGDLAKGLLGVGKDVLQWLGVWGTVDDVATFAFNKLKDAINAIGNFLGLGSDEDEWKPAAHCGSLNPKDYFANNYLACVSNATSAMGSAGNVNTAGLDSKCTQDFNACVAPKNRASVGQICGAMSAALSNLAGQVSGGIRTAADLYTGMGGPANYVNELHKEAVNTGYGAASRDFCDPKFWDPGTKQHYAGKCADFVNQRFPLPKPASMGGPVCTAMPPSSHAARSACFDSVDANTNKDALVGPNGEYCRRQKEWEARNPWKVVITGTETSQDGNYKWNTFEIRLDNRIMMLDPWFGSSRDMIRVMLASGGSRKTPFVGGSGGSSGSYLIDGRTGNAGRLEMVKLDASAPFKPGIVLRPKPESKPARPVADRPPAHPIRPSAGTGSSSGSSGAYTSRQPGNAAVDRLSGDGMGGGFRSGGSSGASTVQGVQNRRPPISGGAAGGVANSIRSGGSSGTNMINSQSGNAPRRSGPDSNIDYGACPGCGKRDTFPQPK